VQALKSLWSLVAPPYKKPSDDLIQGYDKGPGKQISAFRPDGSFITIQIDVPGYAASKLSLKRGDSATICMCPERLFLLSE
jgi:hypothetical protein